MIKIDKVRFYLGLMIIPLGIIIIQFHAVPFWYSVVGFKTEYVWLNWLPAIIWSLTLELVSIWRWLVREHRIFAVIVTILLVGGPLMQTVEPLYVQVVTAEVSSQDLKEAEGSVKYFEDLIESGRRGWQDDLRTAKEDLKTLRKNAKIVQAPVAVAKSLWVVISLTIFTLAIVTALSDLAGEATKSGSPSIMILRLLNMGLDYEALERGTKISAISLRKMAKGEPVPLQTSQEASIRLTNLLNSQ